VAQELGVPIKPEGLRWYRYPLAFLTEAADDICYGIMDLEDGYKHGMISFDEASNLLIDICNATSGNTEIKSINNIKDEREKIGYLRAKSINSLIYQVTAMFMNNEANILNGQFDQRFLDLIESNEIMNLISKISKEKLYSYRPVIQIEAAGFEVLPGLLKTFLLALQNKDKESSEKILQLIPKEYILNFQEQTYDAIMSITTYIAGMTDEFAIDTYRNLRGIQLPNC
jgi:dGTPase